MLHHCPKWMPLVLETCGSTSDQVTHTSALVRVTPVTNVISPEAVLNITILEYPITGPNSDQVCHTSALVWVAPVTNFISPEHVLNLTILMYQLADPTSHQVRHTSGLVRITCGWAGRSKATMPVPTNVNAIPRFSTPHLQLPNVVSRE